jgi:hypothetical protein
VAWHRDETPALGQVLEFLVWAELGRQSAGLLHVFLPLLDRGLDALVHRLSDGDWIPLQVKGSSEVVSGRVWLRLRSASLVRGSLVVGAWLDGDRLGSTLLVIDDESLRRVATPSTEGEVPVLDLDFPAALDAGDPLAPYLVARDELGRRLGVPGPPALPPLELGARSEGLLGELEVLRALAEEEELELHRPFPDLETAEIAVRHSGSGRVLGLQVKTIAVARGERGAVVVKRRSFRPAPDVFVVALAWLPAEGRFHEECLLIPSLEVPSVGYEDGEWWLIHFHPGSTRAGVTAPYRRPLAGLARELTRLTGGSGA